MDFGDIMRIFIFILIPIIIKSVSQKKKIEAKNTRKPIHSPMTSTDMYDAPTPTYDTKTNAYDVSTQRNFEQSKNVPKSSVDVYSSEKLEKIDKVKKYNSREKIEKKISRKKIPDVIKQNEIGSQNIDYSFEKKDLVKGIIMSEILSKPKGLQRQVK